MRVAASTHGAQPRDPGGDDGFDRGAVRRAGVVGHPGVFVPEDLQFLASRADALRVINDRLMPLVAISGAAGFVAAVGVHAAVGYLDLLHVGPAVLGSVVFAVGLGLTFPYL
jgi:dihydroorotate dehydrogenase